MRISELGINESWKKSAEDVFEHAVLDERKESGIFQSAALKVLDNLAARKDNKAFPVKFYDGTTINVSPTTARKFINFYDDAELEKKRWILSYLKTKKGFLELMDPRFVESTLEEAWSAKYKRSIDCNNPKGFSQRAHCQGRKKNENVNEGYKLQLERDPNMYVLHILDTKTGKRTEVRGKSGYESGNHDYNDRLHQLLDKLGKAANFAELMNGEVVTINPKHPDATKAKTATDVAFNEALDQPYPVRWSIKNDNEWYGHAKEDDFYNQIGIEIKDGNNSGRWNIRFKVGDKMDKTGEGDQFKIFATVKAAIQEWWNWVSKNTEVNQITFSAEKIVDGSRSKLYHRFAQQFARAIGYEMRVVPGRTADIFYIEKPGLEENFADGKVKGKSRPGRVKRAGASCNGSVTELRAKAKKYSGERGKMYHWCANMKAGKK